MSEILSNPAAIVVIVAILVIGWILLRAILKLTAAIFRIGCFIIILIAAGVLVVNLLG